MIIGPEIPTVKYKMEIKLDFHYLMNKNWIGFDVTN